VDKRGAKESWINRGPPDHNKENKEKKMAIKTIEEFNAYAETLDESVDRRKLAKALGLELPKEPPPPVAEQLASAGLVTHTPKTKGDESAVERTYVEIPALKLEGETGTRKVWVRVEVARAAFTRGLEVCDEHNL